VKDTNFWQQNLRAKKIKACLFAVRFNNFGASSMKMAIAQKQAVK